MMDDKTLAGQLRCPSGEAGHEVGKAMNEHNRDMNQLAIRLLVVEHGHSIWEIGPGIGAFVPLIFERAQDIKYTGLDISRDMISEASARNQKLIESGKARWVLGSTENIPFEDNLFDRIVTVNTLYFLQPPQEHIREVKRVLKPGGKLILCIGSKQYMQQMPFTVHGFTLYSREEAHDLLKQCGLEIENCVIKQTEVTGLTDEPIAKETLCFIARKPQ